jgi:RHS repeat-associated protein
MKKVVRGLAFLLISALFMQVIPTSALAKNFNDETANKESVNATEVSKYSKIIGEIEEKREENTKYFLKEDNTMEAVVYPEPVHYQEDGEWKEIDNSLGDGNDEGDDALENTNSNLKFNFGKYSNSKKLVSIKKDKYKISWSLEGANKSKVEKRKIDESKLNEEIEQEADKTVNEDKELSEKSEKEKEEIKDVIKENEKKKTVPKIQSTATYRDVFENTDLEYEIQGNNLKENIILKDKTDESEFTFRIDTKNVIAKVDKNVVKFYDEDDESKEVFSLLAPFMVDNEGVSSDDIKISLEKDKKGYTLTLTPNKEWLESEDRVYPVKIDPPVTSSQNANAIEDSFVCSRSDLSNNNYYNAVLLRAGNGNYGITRSFLKFTLPAEITSADMVIDAKLYLALYTNNSSYTQINAHKVLNDWNSRSINWNNAPNFGGNTEDYQIVGGSMPKNFSWDITSIAKEWYTTGNNFGVMLKSENDLGNYQEFLASDTNPDYRGARPLVGFSFVNNTGLESYWTYHSQDVGRAGTGYVNDYNGNLIFTHNDITMSGNRLPVSITHVYNENERGKNIGFGQGYRLNLSQKVYGTTISGTQYYIYEDEDGTKHYFKADNISSMKADTLADTELCKNSDGSFRLKDKKDNKINFNSAGTLVNITDKNNNVQTINYTNGKISSVTDGANRMTTLNYNSQGLLSEIVAPDKTSKTTYGYSGSQLTSITYPDGAKSIYVFDGDNKMVEAENPSGYRMSYHYYEAKPYRISQVREYTKSLQFGNDLNISYGYNATTFTDIKGKSSVYQFDNSGKTVSTKDAEGNAKYYKFENATNTTKLSSDSKLEKTVINYSPNSGAETDEFWAGDNDGGTGTYGYTTEEKHLGSRSLKITKSDNVLRQYMQQLVTVEKGKTYTFSAYVKTKDITSKNNCGASLAVYYINNKGTYEGKRSNFLTGTNDWTRISVTFTVPVDAASETLILRPSLDYETGTAYFDDFQLEEGSVANRLNLIHGGDIGGSGPFPNRWGNNGCESGDQLENTRDTNHPKYLNNQVFRMNGGSGKNKRVGQCVFVSGVAGDTYDVSAWGKGASVPKGVFGIQVAFLTDQGAQWETINFNRDTGDWQYVNSVIKAKRNYSRIDVYLCYLNNANIGYFDGIQLYKEEFGNSYTYDDKGNLISVEDNAKKKSKFEYDTNNNLVKSIDPKGSEFKYEHDSKHNVTKATTAENVVYNFKYDNNGNPVASTIGNGSAFIGATANYTTSGNYMSSITDSSGNKTSYNYNEAKGTLSSVTDANGKTTDYSYDAMNREKSVSKIVDGKLITNSYDYKNDRISKVTHNGFDYNFDYDDIGNNTKVSVGNVPLITNNYEDKTGKLLDFTYGNGQKVTNIYDEYSNIVGKSYNGDSTPTITYGGYVQNQGMKFVSGSDDYLGTTGQGLRLESLNIAFGNAPEGMKIRYQANVQGTWQNWVDGKNTAGTQGQNLRMEAVRIKLEGAPAGYSLQYQVHVQDYGWMAPVKDGELAGTINESKRIEAIRIKVIKLRNSYKFDANSNLGVNEDYINNITYRYNYDISNRLTKVEESNGNYSVYGYDNNNNKNNLTEKVNNQNYGTNYAFDKDNKISSVNYSRGGTNTIAYAYDLFGRLSCKNTNTGVAKFRTTYNYAKGNGSSVGVNYSSYVSSTWQNTVTDGNVTGTTGQELPMQGLKLSLSNAPKGMKIKYQVNVSGKGWMDYVSDGAQAGVLGSNIEAVRIALEGAEGYHVQYQAHVADKGWMDPVVDGDMAGTTGQSLRIEALRISIVSDGIKYSGYTQSAWQNSVGDGAVAGTTGKAAALQGLKLSLSNVPAGMKIKYQVHVSGKGWMDYVYGGAQAGVLGSNIEAVRIALEGAPEGYHVQYQAHVGDKGWMDPVLDGDMAGTTGQALRLEALKITIIKPGSTDTTRIASINNNGSTLSYTYDKNGNIETVTDGTKVIKYYYNELNELIREDNGILNKTIAYTYDAGGNILNKKEYALTSGALGAVTATIPYVYGDANWKDKLTTFNGKAITYDQIGNPLTYGDKKFTWEMGRQLKGITGTNLNISYKYNDSGIRTEKTVNGVTTKYHLLGNEVTFESNGTDNIYYTYDSSNNLLSMNLNGAEYYYIRNVQGDIIGLHDKDGKVVVSYVYDSWGKLISTTGSLASTVGVKNPYRYRGYRYDTETGLYYLQSRYYNSDWGRFINADGIIGKTGDLLGHNLFSYCKNNPVNMSDPSGFISSFALGILGQMQPVIQRMEEDIHPTQGNGQTLVSRVKKRQDDDYSAYKSAKKASSSSMIDKAGETISGALIKGKKEWKDFGTMGLSKYVYKFSPGAKIGRKALGYAGTIGFTAWDVGNDIWKGEYFSAGVDATSSGLCVLAGIGLAAMGAPAVVCVVLGFGAAILADKISTEVKNKYYGG